MIIRIVNISFPMLGIVVVVVSGMFWNVVTMNGLHCLGMATAVSAFTTIPTITKIVPCTRITSTTTTTTTNRVVNSMGHGQKTSSMVVQVSKDTIGYFSSSTLLERSDELWNTFDAKEMSRVCKVRVGPVMAATEDGRDDGRRRLGLIATQAISKGETCLSLPYDERYEIRPDTARSVVFPKYLPESYDSWTGDAGLIALMILNEVHRSSRTGQSAIPLPKRSSSLQQFMDCWIRSLPIGAEQEHHPLLWSEDDQEVLQSSTTKKIYKQMDDIEDDVAWLTEHVFDKDRNTFPESVTLRTDASGQTLTQVPCFSLEGYKWAMSLALSRSFFLDGMLRVLPILDMCNHSDDCADEIQDIKMGPFRTIKGASLVASQNYQAGDEVYCSYGPKSAADYLLEHGFVPESCWKESVCEVTFEIDPADRFYDDKLDILEFETYSKMDPIQSFDLVSAPSTVARGDGEPDPAMIQFLRLSKLGRTDAFLLESIFRKDVWDLMAMPVSEQNERDVIEEIIDTCNRLISELQEGSTEDPSVTTNAPPASSTSSYDCDKRELCQRLRASELKALRRTISYLEREKQAVDLKEYYQQRRLKNLGLDSQWTPDDDDDNNNDDGDMTMTSWNEDTTLRFDQKRQPGGADYDW